MLLNLISQVQQLQLLSVFLCLEEEWETELKAYPWTNSPDFAQLIQ